MKKYQNITRKLQPVWLVLALLVIWQVVSGAGLVPKFMLPSPLDVVRAFVNNLDDLAQHAAITLTEALIGLGLSIVLAFVLAMLMDRFAALHRAIFPLLVISQTIPTVAIAPLLVLWLGYGIVPKIALIVMVCFFPIAVGILDGFASCDPDSISLLRTMGARPAQIFRHVKLPAALTGFFSGLKIAVAYSIVGAVISEWLGGNQGLGVYMIRVKKSYSFDKMFAVILLIIIISLLLVRITVWLEYLLTPWRHPERRQRHEHTISTEEN
jgi:ABC-type nitrate/sulfonate/bicarbonate transport system permease component